MKIFFKAKAGAQETSIEKIDETHFAVSVKELPWQGRANRAITDALADYFNIAPSRINLVSGFSVRQKTFEIL